jgi:hypothetical protein
VRVAAAAAAAPIRTPSIPSSVASQKVTKHCDSTEIQTVPLAIECYKPEPIPTLVHDDFRYPDSSMGAFLKKS